MFIFNFHIIFRILIALISSSLLNPFVCRDGSFSINLIPFPLVVLAINIVGFLDVFFFAFINN